ncbi:MAG: hypothetical protein Q4E88_04700 [Coriobacteriia bacterium]|nr:hypothetical protein [Coriobacteriia bacterium]
MKTTEAFSKYINFTSKGKKQTAHLCSSNSIIGDNFTLSGKTILNKFNQDIGEVDADIAREISILKNKNFTINIYLTFVAYSDGGAHWGEILIIAHDPKIGAFKIFCDLIQKRLEQGNRPKFEIDKFTVNKIIETNGKWQPKELMPKPKLEEGQAIIKSKMGFLDKLVEAARDKNPGCYVGSIFFLMMVAGLIFCLIMGVFGF